jgi:hypothetical protein
MSRQPSKATKELLRLYVLAAPGEYNLPKFFEEHPELRSELGVALDGERDDAALGLELAPVIGRLRHRAASVQAAERVERAAAAARRLSASAVYRDRHVEFDAGVLLGDLLADSGKKYIGVELDGARVLVLRSILARARACLRIHLDLAGFADEAGLHLVWRGGRGGLNLRPQQQERGAGVLLVDLRRPCLYVARERTRQAPTILGDILGELGLA